MIVMCILLETARFLNVCFALFSNADARNFLDQY